MLFTTVMRRSALEPEKLRPELHQKIEAMNADQLELLKRVMLKLELDHVVEQLHNDFDAAREEGKLDEIDAIIREVRARRPYK